MSHFKIALVNPRDTMIPIQEYSIYENLGLAMLAAVLREQGYQVRIVDCYAENIGHELAATEIVGFRPELVGFTCTYQSYPEVLRIGSKVKQRLGDVHFTIGGEHATYTADEILSESKLFDSVVRGEGEETILELVRSLECNQPLESVMGIHFQRNGRIIANRDRPAIEDLDKLPFASRDTLDSCLKAGKNALIGMLASRGCHSNCSFCNAHKYLRLGGGRVLRRRSSKNVVDELTVVYQKHISERGNVRLFFYDANFVTRDASGKQWVREIAEGIRERGIRIPFDVFARADSFSEDDVDLMEILKKAGLSSVFVGFESSSDEVLSAYNKGISERQNISAVDFLRKHSILGGTSGFIMFGPYTTLTDLTKNAKFLLQIGQATLWNLSQRLQLFPGISLIDELRREGLLKSTYSSLNVFGYEFRDPRVGLLAERLDLTDDPVAQKENSVVRYIKETLEGMERLMDEESRDCEAALGLRGQLTSQIQHICDINFRFFADCVDLAAHDSSELVLEKKKTRHMKRVAREIVKLESLFEAYLSSLDRAGSVISS